MKLGSKQALDIYLRTSKRAGDMIDRISNWDPEKTIKENAYELKIGYQHAVELSKKYQLKRKAFIL